MTTNPIGFHAAASPPPPKGVDPMVAGMCFGTARLVLMQLILSDDATGALAVEDTLRKALAAPPVRDATDLEKALRHGQDVVFRYVAGELQKFREHMATQTRRHGGRA